MRQLAVRADLEHAEVERLPGPTGEPARTRTRVNGSGTVIPVWQTDTPGASVAAGMVGLTPIVNARSRSSRAATPKSASTPKPVANNSAITPALRIEACRDDGKREGL